MENHKKIIEKNYVIKFFVNGVFSGYLSIKSFLSSINKQISKKVVFINHFLCYG